MEFVREYFLTNFFLICLAFGVIFMVLRTNRTKKNQILMPIFIVSTALVLSVVYAIERWCVVNPEHLVLGTVCFYLGFALRPLVLYFFLRLSTKNKLILRISLGLIVLNAVIYAFVLFIDVPALSHLIYWYTPENGVLVPARGPLYYFSYFITGAMVIYLVVYSIGSLTGRHRYDALASLICVVFVGLAVVFETILYQSTLLNTTIAIACLFYVVHLYQQAAHKDGLTGLYDRKTYYSDSAHLGNRIVGVIMVDMNGLKYLNDNQGHLEGDKAIIAIARALEKAAHKRYMYVYRLGGDEFLIISTATKPGTCAQTVVKIREILAETPYSASIGMAIREDPNQDVDEMFTQAEKAMYADKEHFYKTSGIERRKGVPSE